MDAGKSLMEQSCSVKHRTSLSWIDLFIFDRELSWEDALYWYDEALNSMDENDEGGEYDSTMYDPPHTLMARMAEMYRQGGHGLEKMAERAGK